MADGTEPNDHLWDEYALIQDKLDKIGDFRFRVKGWAVTLVSSLSIGASAASLPTAYLFITIPIVILFWVLEENQKELQSILISRALVIERTLPLPERAPASRQRYRTQLRLGRFLVAGLANLRRKRRLVSHADHFFYVLLLAVLTYVMILSGFTNDAPAKDPAISIRIDSGKVVLDSEKGRP